MLLRLLRRVCFALHCSCGVWIGEWGGGKDEEAGRGGEVGRGA